MAEKKEKPEEIIEEEIVHEDESELEDEISEDEEEEELDEMAAMKAEIVTLAEKSAEYLDGWQRARAEFANYKKRVERERAQSFKNASGKVILQFLPVLDDLERAMADRPAEGNGASWAEGIDLVYRKLQQILEAEGVKPMDAEGAMFDPTLHEAVVSMPSDEHESGQIIEVMQRGYTIGDRVLRPAMVRVAA